MRLPSISLPPRSTAGSRCSAALVAAMALASGCAAWQQPGESLHAPTGPGGRMFPVASGRRLYAEVRGDEHTDTTPVLLVHGFASNHEVWAPIEPAVRARHRTINVDLPGFGASERLEGDYSPAAIARDLANVLDAVGVYRVDLVGHSWGSSISLAFALAYPERVRRIVLVGAWIYDEQIPPFFRWARAPGIGEMLFTGFYRERPEDRFPMAFEDPSIVTQELVEAIGRSLERPGTERAALAAARGQCFLQQEGLYRTITQRTLLVWGANDSVARLRFGERLARDLPHATMEVFARVGHFPMLEYPSRTRAVITAFLDAPESESEVQPAAPPSSAPSASTPSASPTVTQ